MTQPLLSDLITRWLADVARDRAARTVLRYASALQHFAAWYAALHHEPLDLPALTPIVILSYRTALQATYAPSTINTHLAALGAWTRWVNEHGYLEDNPVQRIKRVPQGEPPAPEALAPPQVHALLRLVSQTGRYAVRNTALVMVLIQTGLRVGECVALKWDDVSFGEKQGHVLVRQGKGNRPRTVPLNRSARQALAAYVAPLLGVAPTLRAVAAAWPKPSRPASPRPLWAGERGPMTTSGVEQLVKTVVKLGAARNLVPSTMTPHTFRHTFAIRYLASHPGDLVGLARILGHRSLETTRTYLRLSEQEIAERVEALDLNAYC